MKYEEFVKGINYLKSAYQNLKVDFENDYTLNVWYDILKGLDYEQFRETIKYYVHHNTFAPQSPASLLEAEKERILKNINIGDKFNKLVERIRENNHNIPITVERYAKGGQHVMAKTIGELKADFQNWLSDSSQLPFLKAKFIKAYRENLDIEDERVVLEHKEQLKLEG